MTRVHTLKHLQTCVELQPRAGMCQAWQSVVGTRRGSCPGRPDRPEGRGKQARQQTDGQITDSGQGPNCRWDGDNSGPWHMWWEEEGQPDGAAGKVRGELVYQPPCRLPSQNTEDWGLQTPEGCSPSLEAGRLSSRCPAPPRGMEQ